MTVVVNKYTKNNEFLFFVYLYYQIFHKCEMWKKDSLYVAMRNVFKNESTENKASENAVS